MNVVLVLLRARRSWRWPVVGLLVGAALAAGGVALTTARTTASAFERVREAAQGDSLTISHGQHPDVAEAALANLEGVAALHHRVGFAVEVDGVPAADIQAVFGIWAGEEYPAGIFLVDGRLPDPARADEVAITAGALQRTDLEIGADLDLVHFSPVVLDDGSVDFDASPMGATVVGVVALPREFFDDESAHFGALVLSPAFARAEIDSGVWFETGVVVADDLALAVVEARVNDLAWDLNQSARTDAAVAQDASRPLVVTLVVLATLVSLAALLVGGLAVARDIGSYADDTAELVALGATERQLRGIAIAQSASIGAIATVVAVVGTALGSAVGPVGWPSDVDPRRGIHPDLAVIALVVIVSVAWIVVIGWFAGRHRGSPRTRPNPLTVPTWVPTQPVLLASTALMLADKRGRLAAGVALGGVSVSVLFAIVVFASSLEGLVAQPARYGLTGDAVVRQQYGDLDPAVLEQRFVGDDVEGVTGYGQTTFLVEETHLVPGVTVFPVLGRPGVSIIDGRSPTSPGEVLAGASTLNELGVAVGDRLVIRRVPGPDDRLGPPVEPPPVEVTIVGSPVIAPIAMGLGPQPARLDEGLWVLAETLRSAGDEPDFPEWAILDLGDVEASTVIAANPPEPGNAEWPEDIEWFTGAEPTEVSQARSALPLLAVTFAVTFLAIGALIAQIRLTEVRRQREQYSLLTAVGFTRFQLLGTVTLQALQAGVVALAIGVPVGVVGGRLWWSSFSNGIGVLDTSDAQPLRLVGLAVLVLGSVCVFGLVPALAACRIDAATVLEADKR